MRRELFNSYSSYIRKIRMGSVRETRNIYNILDGKSSDMGSF
jgi:hypothetical protein